MPSQRDKCVGKFLASAELSAIIANVLKDSGAIEPERLKQIVCSVAKCSDDEFDAFVADHPEVIGKLVKAAVESKVKRRANVLRKAETDETLGWRIEEREDPSLSPKQRIQQEVSGPDGGPIEIKNEMDEQAILAAAEALKARK